MNNLLQELTMLMNIVKSAGQKAAALKYMCKYLLSIKLGACSHGRSENMKGLRGMPRGYSGLCV
jgi:hypothetical protein